METNTNTNAGTPVVHKDIQTVKGLECPFAVGAGAGLCSMAKRCEGTCAECPITAKAPKGAPALGTVYANDREYEFSHGHAPRNPSDGAAPWTMWAFEIGGKTFWLRGRLGECKRTARIICRVKGEYSFKVLP